MKRLIQSLLVCAIALGSAHAAKLFSATATYNGGADTLTVENHSLPDLIDDLIKGVGDFSALKNETVFDSALTYFAFPNALDIRVDRSDPQILRLRLRSALTGLDKNFEATSEDDMKRQLTQWLYLDGSDVAAALLSALIKSSAAVITDGSPGSTTAQMTDMTFRSFGFYPGSGGSTDMRGSESGAHFGLWFDGDAYTISSPAGDLDGTRWKATIPLWLHFNQRISLTGVLELGYNSLEGTEFYGLGADIGLAIRPVVRKGEDRFGWQIVPYLGGYGIGSIDGVTAAVVSQVGAVNRLEWRVFDRSLVSLVTQYATFDNLRINIGEFSLSTPIDQNLLKNGLMYEFPLLSSKRFYGNLSFIDTRFLKESRVGNFQTYGVGLAYRRDIFSILGSVGYDHSNLYSGTMCNLGVVWDL